MSHIEFTEQQIKDLIKDNPSLRNRLQNLLIGGPHEGALDEFTMDQTNMRVVRIGSEVVMRPIGEIDNPDLYQNHIWLNTEKFDFNIKTVEGQGYLEITDKVQVEPPEELKIEEPKKSKKK
jgi:hypothetical protein